MVFFAVLVDNVEKTAIHYMSICRISNISIQPILGSLLNQNEEEKSILIGTTNFCTGTYGTATSDCCFGLWENTTSCGESDNVSRELVNGIAEK